MEEVKHYQMEQKYKIIFEQVGSAKGTMGFKVEANGDNIDLIKIDVTTLLEFARSKAPPPPLDK